jgi:hypothetical protein
VSLARESLPARECSAVARGKKRDEPFPAYVPPSEQRLYEAHGYVRDTGYYTYCLDLT